MRSRVADERGERKNDLAPDDVSLYHSIDRKEEDYSMSYSKGRDDGFRDGYNTAEGVGA